MNPSVENQPDVLPPWANRLMILLWLLLFGVRWLVLTPLEWTGALSPDTMSFLDDVLLLRVYLLLFAVTCIVLGLRAARSASASGEARQASAQSVMQASLPAERAGAEADLTDNALAERTPAADAPQAPVVSRSPARKGKRRD